MTKRWKMFAGIMLAGMMMTGTFSGQEATEEDTQAAQQEEEVLPAPGETVEGFTAQEVRYFPLVGAKAVLFEHEKTGAQLVYIANQDTNRVFDLTFFTRAIDNTGLPHVFEHATLNGSEKYPSTRLFFNLSYQTYNTFMNAMTYPLMTTYPVASLSEEQLLKYADFYTDSCLHPSIMTEESIYREEAWRYRLESEEAPLTLEGTVYSEMLGSLTLDSQAYCNALRAAFPGSTIGNVSGGDPDYIPDMTWEDLKDYHNRYYVPSNCVAWLYGSFDDYAAFLRLLDEAFAGYERETVSFEDPDYQPITENVEQSLPFPVETSSDPENGTDIYYAFVCPGAKGNLQEELLLDTLTDLLSADASPLMQDLEKALPSGEFDCATVADGPEILVMFEASNVNQEDAQTFRDIVDKTLDQLAQAGFDEDMVEGVVANLSLSVKLTSESNQIGVGLIPQMAAGMAASGLPFYYLEYVDVLDQLDAWNQDGLFAQVLGRYFKDSETSVLVSTYPEPGLKEQKDEALAQELAKVKEAMTPEEIQALVQAAKEEDAEEAQEAAGEAGSQTAEEAAGEAGSQATEEAAGADPEAEDNTADYVAALQAVTVDSLPEEARTYSVEDVTGEDGVRHLNAAAGVDGIGQTMILLDAAGLGQDQLGWFSLYLELLGEMDTSAHTKDELDTLMTRYLYNGDIRLSLVNTWGTAEYHPYLRAGWIAANEDLETGYDLMYEILYDTQFTDYDALSGQISQAKAALKSSITGAPYDALLYRTLGAGQPMYAYYDSMFYLDFYEFLTQAEQLMEEDPQQVQAQLEEIRTYFHNRTGAVAAYAGCESGIETNRPLVDAFLGRLDQKEIVPQTYEFEKPAKHEALIVDTNVQFNGVVGDYAAFGAETYSADLDAVASLVTDLYLMPQLREQYGVYSPMHSFIEEAGTYILAYRDPNIAQTFDVLAAIPDFISQLEVDQETVDGYILSAYSYYAMPEGELTGALDAITNVLTQTPADLKISHMRELKALTPEKVAAYADSYASLVENGYYFTAGSAAAINENAQLFDTILNPFAAVDSSQVEMSDVPEDHPHFEAVRFVFENQLMTMADEETFGVDEDATYGDLAGALYAMSGGDCHAQEEAVGALAGAGILPADAAVDAPLTGKDYNAVMEVFCQMAQISLEAPAETEDVLTRGDLAELLKSFAEPLMQG